MRQLDTISSNIRTVRGILSGKKNIHPQLDRMINTVRILYTSKRDFIENFPDQDDIRGKIKLIVSRRK